MKKYDEKLLEDTPTKAKVIKKYKCVAIKDSKGLINIDITEIYNIEDDSERYPTGFRQWRIGELIPEENVLFYDGLAWNTKLIYAVFPAE